MWGGPGRSSTYSDNERTAALVGLEAGPDRCDILRPAAAPVRDVLGPGGIRTGPPRVLLAGAAARCTARRVPRILEAGDSTGILELIEFLESNFRIEVSEAETVPQNLGSISALTEFVTSKLPVREPTF